MALRGILLYVFAQASLLHGIEAGSCSPTEVPNSVTAKVSLDYGQQTSVECLTGFLGGGVASCSADGVLTLPNCVDVDECFTAGWCGNGGTCHNTEGSFICQCPPGFVASKLTGKCVVPCSKSQVPNSNFAASESIVLGIGEQVFVSCALNAIGSGFAQCDASGTLTLPTCLLAQPAYFPSGVQTQVEQSVVTDAGWTPCMDTTYAYPTTQANLDACAASGEYVLLAAKHIGSSKFALLAAGKSSEALAHSPLTWKYTVTIPTSYNGVFWYNVKDWSAGFSSTNDVYLSSADTRGTDCERRLSWHLHGFVGGFRAGCVVGLNGYSVADTQWHKYIYVASAGAGSVDTEKLFVSPLTLAMTEADGTASLSIALRATPTAPVSITVTSASPNRLAVQGSSPLIFTTGRALQVVTLQAIPNNMVERSPTVLVTIRSTSEDASFNNVEKVVAVKVVQDDVAGRQAVQFQVSLACSQFTIALQEQYVAAIAQIFGVSIKQVVIEAPVIFGSSDLSCTPITTTVAGTSVPTNLAEALTTALADLLPTLTSAAAVIFVEDAPVCGSVAISHATTSPISGVFGSPVTVTCAPGYEGGGSAVCSLTGLWILPIDCTPVPCPSLVVANAAKAQYDGVYLTEAIVQCLEGYQYGGSTTCQANKQWSTPIPECKPVPCPSLSIPNASPNTIEGQFGTSAAVSCIAGYSQIGSDTAFCTSKGTWQEPVPKCVEGYCTHTTPLMKGSDQVGSLVLRMNGQLLAFEVAVDEQWVIVNLHIHASSKTIPIDEQSKADITKFHLKSDHQGATRYTVSSQLTDLGQYCSDANSKAIKVAAHVVLRNVKSPITISAWADGEPISSADAESKFFRFAASCQCPLQDNFLAEGVVAAGVPFVLQLKKSKVDAAIGATDGKVTGILRALQAQAKTARRTLLQETTDYNAVCEAPPDVNDVVPYFEQVGEVVKMSAAVPFGGECTICLGSSAQPAGAARSTHVSRVAYSSPVQVSGVTSLDLNGVECLELSSIQHVSGAADITIKGIDLLPQDAWWLIPADQMCNTNAIQTTNKGANARVVAESQGPVALCYTHEGVTTKMPTCAVMQSTSQATTSTCSSVGSASLWIVIGITTPVILLLIGGICWLTIQLRRHRRELTSSVFDPYTDQKNPQHLLCVTEMQTPSVI